MTKTYELPAPVPSIPVEQMDSVEGLPIFDNPDTDYTQAWGKLLQGGEAEFPIEASFANHYFSWPHVIDGHYRGEFDCTKVDSYKFIPPEAYLAAYNEAKERGEI